MKTGFFFTNRDFPGQSRSNVRNDLYDQIRDEIASRYKSRLERADSWEQEWLNWIIDLLADIRYNRLLFSAK